MKVIYFSCSHCKITHTIRLNDFHFVIPLTERQEGFLEGYKEAIRIISEKLGKNNDRI